MVWDVNRKIEWQEDHSEARVVEKLSPTTEIIYLRVGLFGLVSDYCILQTKKIYPDGSIVILGCSVDHKDVPNYNNVKRAATDFISYVLHPLGDSKCEVTTTYLINLTVMNKLYKAITSSEFILKKLWDEIEESAKNIRKTRKDKEEKGIYQNTRKIK